MGNLLLQIFLLGSFGLFILAIVVQIANGVGRMQEQGDAYNHHRAAKMSERVDQDEDNLFLKKWADGTATPEDQARYEQRQQRKRDGGYW